MKIFIRGVVSALAVGLVGTGGAEAQIESHLLPSYPCTTAELMYMGSPAADCRGWFWGNNSGAAAPAESLVIDYINNQWAGDLGYSVSGGAKTEEGSSVGPFENWGTGMNAGTLTFDAPIYGNFVVALKGARRFALYRFAGADGWSSLDFDIGGPRIRRPGLSHVTLYGGRMASVPEPSTLFLIGTGILALSGMAWRRREEALARV